MRRLFHYFSTCLEPLEHAVEALRQSHPGIVIDTRYDEFDERYGLAPRWFPVDRSFARRRLDER